MLKFLIADDHAAIREGIKQFLKDIPDEVVFGEAVDGYEALEKAKLVEWDLIILDLKMPNIDGFIVLKLLKQWCPDLPILVYSVYSEDQFAKHMLRFGANGYLSKDSDPQKLLSTVRAILSGGDDTRASLADKQILPEELDQPPDVVTS
jgi:two-component system, NarL family, invasion response regulator UvrY